jgi:hypothetical protein
MSPASLDLYPKFEHEPKVHPLIRTSFVFVPTAGMRVAPEVLVLELMRETFFPSHFGEPSVTRNLNPDELDETRHHCYSDRERAVLHALRGRRKQTKNTRDDSFFAPAYPQLAERAWLGKKRERVLNNFLLSGPVAQYLWDKGAEAEEGKRRQRELVERLWRALLGSTRERSCWPSRLGQKASTQATRWR